VLYARAAGLSDAEIAAVATGDPEGPSWSDADSRAPARGRRAARAAVDRQRDLGRARIALESGAARGDRVRGGSVHMLSMVAGALAVPLEDGLQQLPPRTCRRFVNQEGAMERYFSYAQQSGHYFKPPA
jgi:hypothetical protein